MYYVKYSHQNSYEEILKDNIEIMNERTRVEKVNHAKRRAFFEGYMKYVANGALMIFVIITFPAVVSIARTKRDIQKERERQNELAYEKNRMYELM